MNSHEAFIHIHQGCFAGTGAIVRLPQCQWSKPDGYGKISQCITTTKHSKEKPCAYFLGDTVCFTMFQWAWLYFARLTYITLAIVLRNGCRSDGIIIVSSTCCLLKCCLINKLQGTSSETNVLHGSSKITTNGLKLLLKIKPEFIAHSIKANIRKTNYKLYYLWYFVRLCFFYIYFSNLCSGVSYVLIVLPNPKTGFLTLGHSFQIGADTPFVKLVSLTRG